MADKAFKRFESTTLPPLSNAQRDDYLRNHTVYLQACVNYIGRRLGWRKYVRLAFGTALTVGAFRGEVVELYFLLRALVF